MNALLRFTTLVSRFAVFGITASILLGSATCGATTLYVDWLAGDNSYDGYSPAYNAAAASGPKRNISAGIGTAANNSVIQITSGSYGESTWNPGNNTITLIPVGTVTISEPVDSDNDGIPDWWEILHDLNPNNSGDASLPSTDPRAHGLSNLQVYQHPSVLIADGYSTLNDGIADWWKVKYQFSLIDPNVANARLACWTNRQKYENGLAASAPDPSFSLPYTANYQTNITCLTTDLADNLYVGSNTYADVLIVQNGGVLQDPFGCIGYEESSSNNLVLVTDSGSVWTNPAVPDVNQNSLLVGWSGAANSLVISNGGFVYNENNGIIGYQESSSNNLVLVTDAGSAWENHYAYSYIGYYGGANSLIVSNGGFVFGGGTCAYLGLYASSSGNSLVISGTGSVWAVGDFFDVGEAGAGNTVTINNGGNLITGLIEIGALEGSTNNCVLVTDPGSIWSNVDSGYGCYIDVGASGAENSLVISNGGQVVNDNYASLGFDVSSTNNTVLVTGFDSVWSNAGPLLVGLCSHANKLVISHGAQVFDSEAYVGFSLEDSSNNSVVITDRGSIWTNESYLYVGRVSAANSLVISNGAQVFSLYGSIGIDSSSSNNTVLVTGPGSVWNNIPRLCVGYGGGYNALILTNGGTVLTTNLIVGYIGNPGNTVELDDGTLTVANAQGNAALDVRGGSLVINSGTCTVDTLWLTNGPNSTLVYNGGTLTVHTMDVDNGGIVQFALGPNSHPITVTGDLTLNGTLSIVDAGGLTAGTYTLFNYAGTLNNGLSIGESSCFASIDSSTQGQINLTVSSIPQITSPAAGAVVDGIVPVQVDLENVPSIESVTLTVDGNDYVTQHSPPFTFYLATHLFANGSHAIAARVNIAVDPSFDAPDNIVSTAATSLDFENVVTVDWIPLFMTQLPISAHVSFTEADWSVEIKSEDGTTLKTLTGSTSNGQINTTWDGTDMSGQSVPAGAQYSFTVSTTPHGYEQTSATWWYCPVTWTEKEYLWGTAQTLLTRQSLWWGDVEATAMLLNINVFINLAEQNPDVVDGNAFVVNGPQGNSSTISWEELQELLEDGFSPVSRSRSRNITQFYYYGHANQNRLGFGPFDDYGLEAATVGNNLGNTLAADASGLKGQFFTPYKFVFLDGCNSAGGGWPLAFGILRRFDDYNYSTFGMKNRAFMGWNVWIPRDTFFYSGQGVFTQELWFHWTEDTSKPLATAVWQAFQDSLIPTYPFLQIFGYKQLTWGE